MIAVIGGHADLLIAYVPALIPQLAAGKLRALGVSSRQRIERFGELYVGQIVPHRKQQRFEHRQRRPCWFAFCTGMYLSKNTRDPVPVYQTGKIIKR